MLDATTPALRALGALVRGAVTLPEREAWERLQSMGWERARAVVFADDRFQSGHVVMLVVFEGEPAQSRCRVLAQIDLGVLGLTPADVGASDIPDTPPDWL